MMQRLTIALALAVFTAASAPAVAAKPANAVADETEIKALFDALETAWKAGDGRAWGAEFTRNADFTVWFGLRLSGAKAIGEGHQGIFDRFYAGTVFDLEPAAIRFLGKDVALVHLDGWIYKAGESRPAGQPVAHPISVVRRTEDGWKIEAFQNTPNFGEPCFSNHMADVIARGGCVKVDRQ